MQGRNALVYVLHNGVKHGVTFWRQLTKTRRQAAVGGSATRHLGRMTR